jgi:menaquinone-dependent protoporphyrinogen oxidase
MKKFLIVYATREGQTQKIAEFIAAELTEAGHDVSLHNAYNDFSFTLTEYDAIICGASLHAGKIESELVKFLETYKETISHMANSFFLVLLAMASKESPKKEKELAEVRENLKKQLPLEFQSQEMFAGALRYSKYNWFIKLVMKFIAKRESGDTDSSRDYEYTNWQRVKSYVDTLK